MSKSLTASVYESFELTVSPPEGFTGEHNAEMLEINISPFIKNGYDYYVIIFDDTSLNGVRKSNEIRSAQDYPAYLDNETVFCPLSAQLTSTGKLRFQVEAHKLIGESSEIKKTSVAEIEFKPSIMSGTDSEFDAASASRLDKLEGRIYSAEKKLEEMKEIPLATADEIGGFKLDYSSPVQLDEHGAATLDLLKINLTNNLALTILGLIVQSDSTQLLYVKNCEEVGDTLDGLTFDMSLGTYSCILFYSEKSGTVNYCDGSNKVSELYAQGGKIYVFRGTGDSFRIDEYNRYSFRKLLLEGVE